MQNRSMTPLVNTMKTCLLVCNFTQCYHARRVSIQSYLVPWNTSRIPEKKTVCTLVWFQFSIYTKGNCWYLILIAKLQNKPAQINEVSQTSLFLESLSILKKSITCQKEKFKNAFFSSLGQYKSLTVVLQVTGIHIYPS